MTPIAPPAGQTKLITHGLLLAGPAMSLSLDRSSLTFACLQCGHDLQQLLFLIPQVPISLLPPQHVIRSIGSRDRPAASYIRMFNV